MTWDDLVKGPITISNHEIDDLVIVRADGMPTYNFAVVVDDWDMRISHVFRGDEHVNNTPWQINIFHALGAPLPAVRATCRSSSATTGRSFRSGAARSA